MGNRDLESVRHHIFICNGESCLRSGGEEVTLAIREQISALDADAQIHTTRTRCNGRCSDACVVIVYPDGDWFREMTPAAGRDLVKDLMQVDSSVSHKKFHSISSCDISPIK
jgi:(2Fe-2S) ferredoxin